MLQNGCVLEPPSCPEELAKPALLTLICLVSGEWFVAYIGTGAFLGGANAV